MPYSIREIEFDYSFNQSIKHLPSSINIILFNHKEKNNHWIYFTNKLLQASNIDMIIESIDKIELGEYPLYGLDRDEKIEILNDIECLTQLIL